MREVRLHDTRSGAVVPLEPRQAGKVGIYACGPTVYSPIHIGNARPFVVFSLLKRFLEHEGYEVTLVMNVTDVNDKIYDAARASPESDDPARRAGRPSAELAAEMTERYIRDTDALGLGRPDSEPLASQSMARIVAYIETLIERGHAYESGGDVFFAVRSDPQYGSLSHRRLEEMDQGEGDDAVAFPSAGDGNQGAGKQDLGEGDRGEREDTVGERAGGAPDSVVARKRDRLDFALWKARKQGEDTWWESPWGPGRPGWHIECSAMAEGVLGTGFEIHGGGSDLVFPHHENEAAQTRAARGQELARIWMHNGMIQMTGEKMAKSAGNIAKLSEVLAAAGADRGVQDGHAPNAGARGAGGRDGAHVVVMYLIGGHYRQPLAFSESEIDDAARRVYRIRDALRRLTPGQESPEEMAGHREEFFDALAEDFNTPRALAALFAWVREANRQRGVGDSHLREMLEVLGMGKMEPLGARSGAGGEDQEAERLAEERRRAREEKDFERADALREQIRARGWEVRDGPDGPELIPLAR